MWAKPSDLHDRDVEWARLTEFLDSPGRGTRLGIVYGRRRQGKTTLLEELCRVAGGFYWQARERELAQNLESLGAAWGAFRESGPSRFASWNEALATLATAGRGSDHPLLVVIDELGYLLARDPSLASELQAVLSPRGIAAREGYARLILCGSALGQMRRLLDPDAPLRGRAGLELVVQPFDFRTAAAFWGLSANPDAAFRLHALVGGTPAYLDLAAGRRPTDGDIDKWVIECLLNPASALFREGRLAVSEDQQLGDAQLYWSLLAAIAQGADRWATLSEALGGRQGTLTHALDVLVDAGWIDRVGDPLRDRGSMFELTEPIVRFHQLVIEQFSGRLRRQANAPDAWETAQPIVRSQIYSTHLGSIARTWLRDFARPETTGGIADEVAASSTAIGQLDIVAVERTTRNARRLIAVGEVKSGHERVGVSELIRLDEITGQLGRMRTGAAKKLQITDPPRKILVSRAGFTLDLRRLAGKRGDTELVDMQRIYTGQ
jgi:uncharacterized protein